MKKKALKYNKKRRKIKINCNVLSQLVCDRLRFMSAMAIHNQETR